jgi:protein-S-isoprenylcysteine O-methyltransferase Ste14
VSTDLPAAGASARRPSPAGAVGSAPDFGTPRTVVEAASATVVVASAVASAARPALAVARSALGATPLLWMMPAIALQSMLMVLEPAATGLVGPGGMAGLSPLQALVALALIGCGTWLIRGGAHELGWNATPVCVDETARALVATGPYRFSRHPMYLGAVAVLLGVAVALGSVLAALVAAGFVFWVDLRHARPEDARLRAQFGPAWRAYAARVRRWL